MLTVFLSRFFNLHRVAGQASQILTTVKVFSKKMVNKSKKCESDRRFSWTKLTEIKLVTQIGVEPHDSYFVIKLITAGSAFNLLKGEAFIIQQKLGNLQKGWCTTWERQMYRCTILLKKSSKQMRAHLFATQSNDGWRMVLFVWKKILSTLISCIYFKKNGFLCVIWLV